MRKLVQHSPPSASAVMAGAGGPGAAPAMAPAPPVPVPGAPVDEDQADKMLAKGPVLDGRATGLNVQLLGKDTDSELKGTIYKEAIDKLFVNHSFRRLEKIVSATPKYKQEAKQSTDDVYKVTEQLRQQWKDQLGIEQLLITPTNGREQVVQQLREIYTLVKHIRATLGDKPAADDVLNRFPKLGVMIDASALGLTLANLEQFIKEKGLNPLNPEATSHLAGLSGTRESPALVDFNHVQHKDKLRQIDGSHRSMPVAKVAKEPAPKVQYNSDDGAHNTLGGAVSILQQRMERRASGGVLPLRKGGKKQKKITF